MDQKDSGIIFPVGGCCAYVCAYVCACVCVCDARVCNRLWSVTRFFSIDLRAVAVRYWFVGSDRVMAVRCGNARSLGAWVHWKLEVCVGHCFGIVGRTRMWPFTCSQPRGAWRYMWCWTKWRRVG